MKKIFGIIKINVLSLIALPLLLLAVVMKLLAKALERIMVGIVAVVILLAALLISGIIQNPSETLNSLLIIILTLVIGGVVTAFIFFLFSVASGVIMVAAEFISGILNVIYELLYGWYSALFHKCKQCYEEQLSEVANPALRGALCLFYSILRVVNGCIIFFVTHALKLLAAAIILFAVWTLYSFNRQTQALLGLNIFTTLGMFPVRDVIAGAVFYAAYVFCFGTMLIAFGLKWNEWGREMKMATDNYEEYLSRIAEAGASLDEAESGDYENEAVLRCREYMSKLNRHFAEAEEFRAETQGIIERSENQMLRSLLGEYMNEVLELLEKMNSAPSGGIPVEEFEKLIPRIKRLDDLKEDIRKLNMKMVSYTPAGTGTGFFAGCDNLQKLEKRYKALCKTYHPDSEAGDEETFKKMHEEYEELKAKLGK